MEVEERREGLGERLEYSTDLFESAPSLV